MNVQEAQKTKIFKSEKMPISQEGENAKIPKENFVPGDAKITKRERVQKGVIAQVFEGVIALVEDYSRGCTCQALQEE